MTCVSGQLRTYDGNSFAVGTLAGCKADMPRLDPLPANHGFAKLDASGDILGLSKPLPRLRLLLLVSNAFLAGNIIRGGSMCQVLGTKIAAVFNWSPSQAASKLLALDHTRNQRMLSGERRPGCHGILRSW